MEGDISCEAAEESFCAVCGEIFLAPLVLSCICCERSFCNCCLQDFWIEHGTKECPLCFKDNYGLPHKTCLLHAERLSMLCLSELEASCHVCRSTCHHMGHTVFLIKEAFKDRKVRITIQSHISSIFHI